MGSGGAGLDIGVGRELFYDQVVTFRPSFLNLDPLVVDWSRMGEVGLKFDAFHTFFQLLLI